MRRVYRKPFSAWSKKIQNQLWKLNFGEHDGQMYRQIEYEPDLDTFVMIESNEVLGWAMVTEGGWAMFYVRDKYRREGVATRLAKRIKRQHKKLRVDGWDAGSCKFFESTGLSRHQEIYG